MRQTPLHAVHTTLNASFTSFAGWQMPLRYESETAEHHAVRRSAGLFDLSHMGQFEITGPQAGQALDYALVGHLSALATGTARYTLLCHDNGGIIDDLVVYRLGAERFLVVANAKNTPVVMAMLSDHFHGYHARVQHQPDRALIALQGPRAVAILCAETAVPLHQLRYYTCAQADIAGFPAIVARTGYTGEDGFEIYCAANDAVALWAALTARGQEHELRPAGLACRDSLRLEAGMPLHGNEIHVGINPFDAGLGRVVAMHKPGDFVGRAALAKRREQVPAQRLTGLAGSGRRAARAGYAITDLVTGARIGTITSGLPSPTLGHPIALGYVPAAVAEPGSLVGVDIRGSIEPFVTSAPKFYKGQSA